MPFNMFPYSNLHNLNLDWILNTVKTMAAAVEAAATTVETYAARLSQVETNVQAITPAATGAVRHDVSQALDAANRRRAATNIHAVSYDAVLLSADEKAQARSNIGAISSGDIPPASNAVLYTAQELTSAQQQQARSNIGAAADSDVVKVSEQSLTEPQRAQARTNIEAVSSSQYNTLNGRVQTLEGSVVKFTSQSLTNGQKAQARTNIGAISSTDIPPAPSAVLYTAQQLTSAQQQQARSNIGAAEAHTQVEIISQAGAIPWYTQAIFANVLAEVTNGKIVEVFTKPINQNRVYRGIFQLNAAGTHLQADLFALVENPYTSEYTTWYRVDWNGATVLNVTEESGRVAPTCVSADAGKVLTVSNSGIPVWERITPIVNTISGTTPTITPADNNIYNCGEVTSLTIISAPATGAYSIVFTSGATATTTTIPAKILGLETFAAEANTIYEINVLDSRAVVGSWAVSA